MHVITVIPLQRGIHTSSLTYFSRTPYPIGTLLSVPLRGKNITAIAIDSQSVSKQKSNLRKADFALRKIATDAATGQVASSLITISKSLQEYYPSTPGAILFALLPTEIKNGSVVYPKDEVLHHDEDTTPQTILATAPDRYTIYLSHIRTIFARNGSVILVVPTGAEIESARAKLETGISERVICLSPHQTSKARTRALQKLYSSKQPVLLITTPSHAYAERFDSKSIIIEHAAHTAYLDRTRPGIDHRVALQALAHATGRSCLLGDTVLRTEDEWRRRQDTFPAYIEPPKRLIFPASIRTIKQTKAPTAEEPFELFLPETVNRIQSALNNRSNVFLYAARRGLAPVIACFDCGNIIRCPESGNPYSLLRTYKNGDELRWFVDSTSGRRVRASDTCDNCGSWRLRERGIGIQHIHDVCPAFFPEAPIIYFDATTARTPKKAIELQTMMKEAKGAIFLGTALALPYLPDNVAISCVTSLEAAASIPSWRADEMLFRLLLELREKSSQEVLIQARHEPGAIIEHASRGSLEHFYTEEILLREQLQYPPYATLILLTWRGTALAIAKTDTLVSEQLVDYAPHVYSDPLSNPDKVTRHALIRIPYTNWPNQKLLTILRNLPPHILIQINPDRIV